MSKSNILLILIGLLVLVFSNVGFCQISDGSEPMTSQLGISALKTSSELNGIQMPAIDLQYLLEEDKIDEEAGLPPRFGQNFEVDYNTNNSGLWETLPNGDRLWRLKIMCPGAFSINLLYSDFWLPEGAMLWLYNEDKTSVIGAFTSQNNKKSGTFSTIFTRGDVTILEYYEPKNVPASGRISISTIVHGYRDVFFKNLDETGEKGFGQSASCNVNVNCYGWAGYDKNAVAMIVVDGVRNCTGSLIRGLPATDEEIPPPYFLTADHCAASVANGQEVNWLFVFNYESAQCSPTTDGSLNYSVSNATLRSSWVGSDFALFELSIYPPTYWNPRYLGWDRSGNSPAYCWMIHHPRGDVKKISIDYDAATDYYANNNFWQFDLDVGTYEGGSSGASILDAGKIVGQLYGGSDVGDCDDPDPIYGKFHVSWNGGGTTSSRLRSWLDPQGISSTTLDGITPQTQDPDGDWVVNTIDNCDETYNPDQINSDGDSHGDACDNCNLVDNEDQRDIDNDGYGNVCDNCPCEYNPDQGECTGVVQWEDTFGWQDDNDAFAVKECADGGFLIGGRGRAFDEEFWDTMDAHLIKISICGDIEWEWGYMEDPTFGAIIYVDESDDGGYYAGSATEIAKFDAAGQLLWRRSIPNSYQNSVQEILQDSDGNFVAVGLQGANSVILKFTPDATLLWETIHDEGYTERGYSVAKTSDGGFIVSGLFSDTGYDQVLLVKYSSTGTEEWFEHYQYGDTGCRAYDVKQSSDGGYIIGGEAYGSFVPGFFVLKIASDRTAQWHQIIREYTWDQSFAKAVDEIANGVFVALGSGVGPGMDAHAALYFVHFNSEGEILVEQSFWGIESAIGYALDLTSDDGCILAGTTWEPKGTPDYKREYMYLKKLLPQLEAPTLVSPEDGFQATDRSLTLNWDEAINSYEYLIEIDDDPSFGSINVSETVSYSLSWTSPDLSDDQWYWRVTSMYNGNPGVSSESRTFTISSSAPEILNIIPNPNRVNIPETHEVIAQFDTQMDETTFGNSMFAYSPTKGLLSGTTGYVIGTELPYWMPDSPYEPGELITYNLTDDMLSLEGLPITNYVGQFTVEVADNSFGTFGSHTYYQAGTKPKSLFFADINGDGINDMAVPNHDSHNISIFIGNGDGTFADDVLYQTGTNPWDVTLADFDGDGDLDMASSNFGTNNIAVFDNNGSGVFGTPVYYAAGDRPHPILTADLDGDIDFDLIVANLNSNNISVYLNNGDGTFTNQVNYEVASGPIGLAAADKDNDGDIDVFVANYFSSQVSILMNNSDGTFAPYTSLSNGAVGPFSIVANDLDGDYDLDLVTANRTTDDISVFIQDQSGNFANPVMYTAGDDPYYAEAADFDGDGDIDIVTANLHSDNISVLANNGNGTFMAPVNYPVGDGPLWVVSTDLNNDKRLDLAVANAFSNNLSIFFNEEVEYGPVLVSPVNGYSTLSHTITLDWDDFTGASSYEVVVDNDINFGSIDRSQLSLASSDWLITPNLGHGTYYWKVRANLTAGGQSPWSTSRRFTIRTDPDPDPSCPVLFTRTDNGFAMENPLLTECEKSGYKDIVTDYYRLTKSPAVFGDEVVLQIRELEDETSTIYDLNLVTVDHDINTEIACDATGKILVLDAFYEPIAAVDNEGNDLLEIIRSKDNKVFSASESGWMEVTFSVVNPELPMGVSVEAPPKKFCREDDPEVVSVKPSLELGKPGPQLTVEYLDTDQSWKKYSDIPPRTNVTRECVVIEDIQQADGVTIRLSWDGSYSIDAVQQFSPQNSDVIVNEHEYANSNITRGELFQKGHFNDAALDKIVLYKGDIWEFSFDIPMNENPEMIRDYIVKATGYYQPDYSIYTDLLPIEPQLHGNYPNPFNPTTEISYSLSNQTGVKLEIFNILGQHVATLVDENQEAGKYDVSWDSKDANNQKVASGIYFYRLTTDSFTDTKKMILLK